MLQLLLYSLIISAICILWGLPLYLLIRKNDKYDKWIGNGLSCLVFLFFSGLLTISLVSSWIIIFMPVRFSFLLTLSIVLMILLIIKFTANILNLYATIKKGSRYAPALFTFTFISILLFLLLGTLKPTNGDTQLYHLQIIKWTNEYGAVPGLANIYPRLGLSSNWFNLISFFYIPEFPHQNFTYLNVTVSIWFLLWLTCKIHFFTTKKNTSTGKALLLFYFFLTAYFLADWQLFRDTANSTAYDFIVTILIIFCLTSLVEKAFYSENRTPIIFLIFISLSVISFKLSGLLILAFTSVLLINNSKNTRAIWYTIVFGILILLPVLIKNYIITGHLLFPATSSIGNPDWQLPDIMTQRFKSYIINANRYYNHNQGFINSINKTSTNWIPYWFNGLLPQHRLLILLSLLSPIILFFKRPKLIFEQKNYKQLILILWIMLAGWFFTAPDPRFAYGFLLITSLLPLVIVAGKLNVNINLTFPLLLITISTIVYMNKKATDVYRNPVLLFYPSATEQPPFMKTNIRGLIFHKTEKINNNWDNRCYFTPLPCLCEENPYLVPRGSKVKDGFKFTALPDSNFVENYNY